MAKAGHPESLRRTAEMLEKGLGVEEDHFEAFDYYLKAAEAGDAIAQYNVAEYLELGLVDEPDLIEASSWFTKSAELGIGDAYAQLGRIASTGALAKSDYGAALDNYEKAIRLGSDWGKFYKATELLEGWGTQANVEVAISMLEELAAKDFSLSQRALYQIFKDGKLVNQDLDKAFSWLIAAADNSDANAGEELGYRLWKGKDIQKDVREAFAFLEKSALEGHVHALYSLALVTNKEGKTAEEKERSIDFLKIAA